MEGGGKAKIKIAQGEQKEKSRAPKKFEKKIRVETFQ
jgi:hypothetical protein